MNLETAFDVGLTGLFKTTIFQTGLQIAFIGFLKSGPQPFRKTKPSFHVNS